MSSDSFKNAIYKMCLGMIYLIYIYKMDLALNNLQRLICHETKSNQKISKTRHKRESTKAVKFI